MPPGRQRPSAHGALRPRTGAPSRVICPLLVALVLGGCSSAVQVDAPAPPSEVAAACADLLEGLPQEVADQPSRAVDAGAGAAAAWGDPPIVLVCGVEEPEEFAEVRVCTTVNGIDWFIPVAQLDSTVPVDLTMTTVNRTPHVEVRMPKEYAPQATTLVDLADPVRRHTTRTGRCI